MNRGSSSFRTPFILTYLGSQKDEEDTVVDRGSSAFQVVEGRLVFEREKSTH